VGEWLTALSLGLSGAPLLALAAATGWGVASILLSPCHLASIPLIVGYIGAAGRMSAARAAATALVFAAGILATIAVAGVATALVGRALGDLGGWVVYLVAVVFFAMGLHLLGVIQVPALTATPGQPRRRGLLPALGLGLVFGLAMGPCTFAFLAPVLGASLALGTAQPVLAAGLTLAFGVGHCAVIVAAGSSAGWVQGLLDGAGSARALAGARKLGGLLLLAGGLFLIYAA
jgi:cytochrome c-type biogenesis protein